MLPTSLMKTELSCYSARQFSSLLFQVLQRVQLPNKCYVHCATSWPLQRRYTRRDPGDCDWIWVNAFHRWQRHLLLAQGLSWLCPAYWGTCDSVNKIFINYSVGCSENMRGGDCSSCLQNKTETRFRQNPREKRFKGNCWKNYMNIHDQLDHPWPTWPPTSGMTLLLCNQSQSCNNPWLHRPHMESWNFQL